MPKNRDYVVITSTEAIIPQKSSQNDKTPPFRDLKDFFNINNHYICDVNTLESKSRESRIIGKHTRMLLQSTTSTFKQSRLEEHKPEDIGLFMSLGMFDYEVDDLLPAVIKSIKDGNLDYETFFKKGFMDIYPLWPLTMLNNIAMCQCAIRLGIKGDNAVFSPHSDSSLNAIYEGWMSIMKGKSSASIVGGVSEIISPMSLIRYILCNTKASRTNTTQTTPPYALSEGAVTFCIEDYEDSKKRGLPCLCSLKGFGSAFGFDESNGGVSTDAIETSMLKAMEMADVVSKDVGIVFTHDDTKTQEGLNEYKAIQRILGDSPLLVSTKPVFGDMLSCAGAFDLYLAIKILLNDDNEYIKQISNQLITSSLSHIMINAMSVEGNVTTLIVGRVG